MGRRALVVLGLAFMTVLLASCGQSYKLDSIEVTPGTLASSGNMAINLEGGGAYQQLTVTAKFSNSKTQDVTSQSTYQIGASAMGEQIAPLESVTVNKSGMVQVVGITCTWDTEPTSSADTAWEYGVVPYKLTVAYTNNGYTSTAQMDVNVDNLAGYCFDGQKFTPPAGFPGNSVVGY